MTPAGDDRAARMNLIARAAYAASSYVWAHLGGDYATAARCKSDSLAFGIMIGPRRSAPGLRPGGVAPIPAAPPGGPPMVETRVVCDRCAAPIAENRTLLRVECGPNRHREPVDLCESCRIAFDGWLASAPDAPAFALERSKAG